MLTCFININYNFSYSSLLHFNIKYCLIVFAFLAIPFSIFIYATIQALIIVKHIKSQKDSETKSIFIKYSLHLIFYILLIILLLIIYLWKIFRISDYNNISDNFRIFSFIVTLTSLLMPVIVGFIQFFLFYVNTGHLSKQYSKKKLKYTYKDDNSILLDDIITKEEKGTFEQLEEKSIKKVINLFSYNILYLLL